MTVHAGAIASGASWVGAFLVGSIPVGHLFERSRLRRDIRRLERRSRRPADTDLRAILGGGFADPATTPPTASEVIGAALDTAKVVGVAVGAWFVVRAVSDPFVYPEVLAPWQSAALWAGLAAAVGHLWSMWLGFRSGGQAQAPLMALALWLTPTGFVVAVAGFLIGRAAGWWVAGGRRLAVLISLGGFVAWTWVAWIVELPHWWGLAPTSEVAVWAGVLGGVVAARNLTGPDPTRGRAS